MLNEKKKKVRDPPKLHYENTDQCIGGSRYFCANTTLMTGEDANDLCFFSNLQVWYFIVLADLKKKNERSGKPPISPPDVGK